MTRQRRRQPGVIMLCLWSLGLGIEGIARLALYAVRLTSAGEWRFTATLPLVALSCTLAMAAGLAMVGLWRTRPWGRTLLLALATAYYGTLLVGSIGLWGPLIGLSLRAPGQGWVTMVVVEAILGLAFGWWYLNRDQIRQWFAADRSENNHAPHV